MDGNTSEPLSTEQAKARLRAAADHASPTAWFQRHTLKALGITVAGGFIIGRMHLPTAALANTLLQLMQTSAKISWLSASMRRSSKS